VQTKYEAISPEMRAAVSAMASAAQRLSSVFSASFVTDTNLLLVKKLSADLEMANLQIRNLTYAN
jgi:hypothetical protein